MKMKLGELLIQNGLINENQLVKALQAQRNFGGKLGTNLVELGFVSEIELAKFLAKQLNMAAASPLEFDEIKPVALRILTKDFADKHKMIPLAVDDAGVRLAISDPHDLQVVDELQFKLGKKLTAVIAPEIWIVAALERYYQIPRETRYISIEDDDEAFAGEVVSTIADAVDLQALRANVEDDLFHSLGGFGEQILSAQSPLEVFQAVFRFLNPIFPRMAIYSIRREEVVGQMLFGFPLHNSAFAKAKQPADADTLIKRVAESNKMFSGKLPQTPADNGLFGMLNIDVDQIATLYPVPFRNRVLAVFVGLPAADLMAPRPEAGKIVTAALKKAGEALEILYLQRKVRNAPQAAKPPHKE